MNSRSATLATRVARAQQEIQTWNARERGTMQLQGDALLLNSSTTAVTMRADRQAHKRPSEALVASSWASEKLDR